MNANFKTQSDGRGRLQDKVAVITGAGTGMGEAIAHKFVREGAKVFLVGLADDPLDDVVNEIHKAGGHAAYFRGDIGTEKDAKEAVRTAVERFGRIDILVNNAGVFPEANTVDEFSLEAFDELVHNNNRSTFLMTKHAMPHLQKTKGNVVSAGSESGELGIANVTPYGATKAFNHAFMKGVAVEQAPNGVRANCVCPGAVDTSWTHPETGPMNDKMAKMVKSAAAMGRRGTVQEIANVYAFIASDEASYVTGACWMVDGGVTVAKGSAGDDVPEELQKLPEVTLPVSHRREGRSGKEGRVNV